MLRWICRGIWDSGFGGACLSSLVCDFRLGILLVLSEGVDEFLVLFCIFVYHLHHFARLKVFNSMADSPKMSDKKYGV